MCIYIYSQKIYIYEITNTYITNYEITNTYI